MANNLHRRRLPHGRRGLKCDKMYATACEVGRLPHGRRGLKFVTMST